MTTNVAMPGAGSLVGGHVSGYAQLALAVGGMALTMVFGVRFIFWYVANWDRFHSPEADMLDALGQMWGVLRWAVLGFVLFGVSWLWALATGLQIVRAAKKAESAAVPPRLERGQVR